MENGTESWEGDDLVSRRILILLAAVAVLIGVVPAAANVSTTNTASGVLAVQAIDRSLDREMLNPDHRPAPALDDVIQVFIQLDQPSVAEYVASSASRPTSAEQVVQRNRVLAQQALLRARLDQYIVAERSSLQVGANGFRAMVTVRDLPAIRTTAGVKSVARVTLHTPTNGTSVPWVGGPSAWEDTGETGVGVSIAVIDTGVDYYHANFGGSGDPDDYTGDDPTIIEPGTFPTAKVVGGWDFVGDGYDASDEVGSPIPAPDPDPLDCHGHGSHVSGSATGFGVLDSGSTYPGPYNTSTHGNSFNIGPGVAPGADLYGLKVFGCDGSTDVVSDALEWALDPNGDGAIDDAVDVINMSLGSPFGSPLDPSAIASDNAAANGVVVVASAGNEGTAAYVTGSPAVAPGAISVAASIDGGVTVGATRINSPAGIAGLIESSEAAFSAPLDDVGPVSGDLVVADPLLACDPLTNPGAIAGNIAYVQRGGCAFVDKYNNAQDAGATALVVFNHSPGPPIVMAGNVATATIPAVFITLADGTTIMDTITGGDTVNVTLESGVVIAKPELADTLAGFTSSGPGHFNSTFKPDIAAPGFSINSTAVGTGTGGSLSSGTSMAAPHVAGMAALIRDVWKDLDPAVVKSLLQNSATPAFEAPNLGGSDEVRITLQGAGVAHVDTATGLDTYTDPAGISFGRLNPLTDTSAVQTVRVHRMDNPAKTFDIDIDEITSVPGVTVSAPAAITVPGSGSGTFDITMTLDVSAMPPDDAFFSQLEADGRVTLTNQADSDDTLNLAYFGVVDPASHVEATPGLGSVTLTNPGPADGWAEGFSLVGEGNDVGTLIGGVGVRTNFFGVDVVEFGVGFTAPWNSLSTYETDIFLDTDQDGFADFVLVAADLGLLTGADPAGLVVTALFNLNTGDFPLEWFAIADNNDHVQTLTVDREGPFGFLTGGDTTFDYDMAVFDLQTDLFAAAQAGTVDLDEVVDGSTSSLTEYIPAGDSVEVDGLAAIGTQGLGLQAGHNVARMLWLFANNPVGDQAATVDVNTTNAPTWPAGATLDVTDVEATTVTLGWPDAVDSDGTIVAYDVWQDGTKIITAGGDANGYTAGGLSVGTTYAFAVTAVDNDGFSSVPLATSASVNPGDTVGAMDASTAIWSLRNSVGVVTTFEFGAAGNQPLMGDWDCDGIDTPGVHNAGTATVALRNTNSSGDADLTFAVGNPGDTAIAGDFDGDGCSTVGVYRTSTGEAFIWNTLPAPNTNAGPPDVSYYFGNPSDKPFTGDFDGDGVDTLGLHRESTGFLYFRNSHTQGIADNEFFYGDPGDRLIAGDWGIVDGTDTPAVFRPSNTTWYFRYTNTEGIADSQFGWGASDWLPVAGTFGLG